MQVPSPLPNPTSSEAMSSSPSTRVHACGLKPGLEVEKKRCRYGNKLRPFPRLLVKINMVLPW